MSFLQDVGKLAKSFEGLTTALQGGKGDDSKHELKHGDQQATKWDGGFPSTSSDNFGYSASGGGTYDGQPPTGYTGGPAHQGQQQQQQPGSHGQPQQFQPGQSGQGQNQQYNPSTYGGMPSGTIPPPPPALPHGWIAQFDPSNQRWFYVEQASGRSQWEVPQDHGYNQPPGAAAAGQAGHHGGGAPPAGKGHGHAGGHAPPAHVEHEDWEEEEEKKKDKKKKKDKSKHDGESEQEDEKVKKDKKDKKDKDKKDKDEKKPKEKDKSKKEKKEKDKKHKEPGHGHGHGHGHDSGDDEWVPRNNREESEDSD